MLGLIWMPILAALGISGATFIQRTILRKRRVGVKLYLCAAFLGTIIAMLPFIWFFWKLDPQAFSLTNIFIFVLVILLAIIANLFLFYSIKGERLGRLEPARVLEPVFVILLAILFSFMFSEELYERNLNIIIPALISAGALIFSHIKRHHLYFNKYFTAAIIASFLFSLELVLTRLILDYYSPMSFYFLRCLVVFVISFIIFKPQFGKLKNKIKLEMLGAGALWVIFRVLTYYGYLELGVVFTTLVIMLGPIFIYIIAWKFLKEKLNWKNIVAAGVIVVSVLYAILA